MRRGNVSPWHASRAALSHGPAAVVTAVGIAAICWTAYELRDSWIGDAAIYLPFARNAANGDFFQYNVGEFSSGSTSPIWPLLLSAAFLFDLGIDAGEGPIGRVLRRRAARDRRRAAAA